MGNPAPKAHESLQTLFEDPFFVDCGVVSDEFIDPSLLSLSSVGGVGSNNGGLGSFPPFTILAATDDDYAAEWDNVLHGCHISQQSISNSLPIPQNNPQSPIHFPGKATESHQPLTQGMTHMTRTRKMNMKKDENPDIPTGSADNGNTMEEDLVQQKTTPDTVGKKRPRSKRSAFDPLPLASVNEPHDTYNPAPQKRKRLSKRVLNKANVPLENHPVVNFANSTSSAWFATVMGAEDEPHHDPSNSYETGDTTHLPEAEDRMKPKHPKGGPAWFRVAFKQATSVSNTDARLTGDEDDDLALAQIEELESLSRNQCKGAGGVGWVCCICEKKCPTRARLCRHIYVHIPHLEFTCSCGETFGRKDSMMNHQKLQGCEDA